MVKAEKSLRVTRGKSGEGKSPTEADLERAKHDLGLRSSLVTGDSPNP